MARDAQTITIGDTTQSGNDTKVDIVPLERNAASPIAPFQLVSMRGSFTLDGSGVGDTADCRISMPLPGNNVYQLYSLSFSVVGTDPKQYDQGLLEIYYAPKPGEFGQTTQLNFGLSPGANMAISQVAGSVVVPWGVGAVQLDQSGTQATNGSFDIQQPFKLIFGGSAAGGTNPVIWIGGGGQTNLDSATCYIGVNFLGYTLEQWGHAGLYTGLITR